MLEIRAYLGGGALSQRPRVCGCGAESGESCRGLRSSLVMAISLGETSLPPNGVGGGEIENINQLTQGLGVLLGK